MEKIKQLRTYLDSKDVDDLKHDIVFYPTVQEAKQFLDTVGKEEVIKLLNDDEKEKFFKIIDEIHHYTESFVATKNISLCHSINHFISQGYHIFFTQIKEFDIKFSETLVRHSEEISKLKADLKSRANEFDIAIKILDSSKEKAGKTVQNIEEQLKKALEIVNEWINNVKKGIDKHIDAKRLQIDSHIIIYKEEVANKFNDLLIEFQKFKEEQIREFEKVDHRRKEFLEMYEIGIKYSKDARFDEYSMKEKKTADVFRWLSLGLMILVVAIIAILTLSSNGEQVWYSILSRYLLVFSLMIPAVYASRESSRHRRNSDKYAQMANELKAFEIAIRTEDMKPEIKDRIKEEIFKRYFGNIFANTSIDKTFSDDIGIIGRVLKPEPKERAIEEK